MANRSRKKPAARKGGGGGKGGYGARIVWFFAVAALIVMFFQIPADPGARGIIQSVSSRAETVQSWVNGVGPGIERFFTNIISGGSSSSAPVDGPTIPSGADAGTAADAEATLATVTVAPAQNVAYNRDEWSHWNDLTPCWTVREQVLATEAVAESLVLHDGNGNTVSDINAACEIASGEWIDPYSGTFFTSPSKIDIDHMVPLAYAARSGGQAWSAEKKRDYANSLTYSNHLVAASASENRSKGDRGPAEWRPSNRGAWCTYAKDWTNVVSGWGLTITEGDATAIRDMLSTCAS